MEKDNHPNGITRVIWELFLQRIKGGIKRNSRYETWREIYGFLLCCDRETCSYLSYDGCMREKGMKALELNCEAEGAEQQLPATGAAAKTFRVFVVERKEAGIISKKVRNLAICISTCSVPVR